MKRTPLEDVFRTRLLGKKLPFDVYVFDDDTEVILISANHKIGAQKLKKLIDHREAIALTLANLIQEP